MVDIILEINITINNNSTQRGKHSFEHFDKTHQTWMFLERNIFLKN